MMKCVSAKQRKLKPKAERPKCPVDCMEEERKARYERLKSCAPPGFHTVLEKIIRNVMLARPIHVYLFIADLLDAELSRRTFDDIVYGCQLKKSQKRQPYPTASCMLLKTWLMSQGRKDVDDRQFLRGPVPQHELTEPALDRYRDYAGVGDFDMSLYELPDDKDKDAEQENLEKAEQEDDTAAMAFAQTTCIPERDLTFPALDRYRDYAGIGPFDPDDVEDVCFDHKRLGFPVPNCKCTFCTLKAEKSRPPSKMEQKDPCAPVPVVQTLYIEQPVYREPKYDKERLFRERDVKAYGPFGAVFQQDEHYKDDGLQPPDPFKEHPVDCDRLADSPLKSQPDDPKEEAVGTPETCEDETPEVDVCDTTDEPMETKVSEVKWAPEPADETVGPTSAEVAAEETAETHGTEAEETAGAAPAEKDVAQEAAGEVTQEAGEEQAPEAAEQENVEESQAAAAEQPPEVEPEAPEETKEEENPEATTTAADEQPEGETEPAEA